MALQVKAFFKALNMGKSNVMQFELANEEYEKLPQLATLTQSHVVLDIEAQQAEIPMDDADDGEEW